MRAGNYYYSAERFISPGAEKMAMYAKALRCYKAAMTRLHPEIERVEVPYGNASLPAYFVTGRGAGRRPTVVLFDGMDNAKEMSVIFAGLDFAKHGINTLAIDGPGQAEALRLRHIVSRHDYEVPGTAAYDYVAARPEVDAKRIAVMGYSFGGYHAPRVAAFEKRYAACVAFGAMHWSIYDWVAGNKARLAVDPRKSSTSIFQFRWVVGAPDNETALEWAKKFTLEGVADKIECAFLVLHGENDRIVPLDAARTLYQRVGSKRKEIKIFSAEEGGAEHCQVDNRQLGIDFIADWLTANMEA
jgi:dipeptidyl aminopeptidase/acylaminoacyl peptidase